MQRIIYCQTAPQTGAFAANLARLAHLASPFDAKDAVFTAPAGALEGGTGHGALAWEDVSTRRDEALCAFAEETKKDGRRWVLPILREGAFDWVEISGGEARSFTPPSDWPALRTTSVLPWSPDVRPAQGTALEGSIAGAEDRIVFAGGGRFAEKGRVLAELTPWEEGVLLVERTNEGWRASAKSVPTTLPPVRDPRYLALVTAVRSYAEKSRASGVVLGLSGGVDSALVLSLAVDALGAERVRTVMLPTDFTSSDSLEDARTLAETLGVRHDVLPIRSLFENVREALASELAGRPWDVTEENIQARLRGLLLMAYANKNGALLLCTSNKGEAAMGYGTLYGDLTGGFAPLIDLWKREVYELCRARNAWHPDIPERILTRAPSAELRPGQKDSDSLPDYDLIEKTLTHYLAKKTLRDLEGVDAETAREIVGRFTFNNFKRAQGIPGPILGLSPALSLTADWGLTRGC